MPKEWAVAADGAATTDPKLGLLGTQTVFGGHKGSALALLVELLGSALSGTDLGTLHTHYVCDVLRYVHCMHIT